MEVAIVQQDAVGAHAFEPAGDGRVGMACVAHHDGNVDTFGHQPEHHFDAVRRGLQVVERGVASAGEVFAAPLAAKMLNVVSNASFAVADKGMDLIIGDAEVVTLGIEAGEPGSADLLLAASSALARGIGFHLTSDRA